MAKNDSGFIDFIAAAAQDKSLRAALTAAVCIPADVATIAKPATTALQLSDWFKEKGSTVPEADCKKLIDDWVDNVIGPDKLY